MQQNKINARLPANADKTLFFEMRIAGTVCNSEAVQSQRSLVK